MIFLAAFNDGPASDTAFASRGEPRLKQGPVSSANVTVFPTERQTAYASYEKNIDAFLAATGNDETYLITDQFYLVGDIEITFPLTIPSANISFKVTDKALLGSVLKRMEEVTSMERIVGVGKHPNAFTIDRPTWKMVDNVLPLLAETPPKTTGKTTFEALSWMKHVYRLVELYLRTNTYPAFRSEEAESREVRIASSSIKRMSIDEIIETATKKLRYTEVNMTHDIEGVGKKVKENGAWIGETSDKEVEFDIPCDDIPVFKAKPSPAKDSRRSWSSPSQAPKMPGILFPYFAGMNSADAHFVRSTVNQVYFRCFEDKEEYTQFRSQVSAFASTLEGIALAHILKGVEISLSAQGQLHLLFDGSTYLGFVVYGAKWLIQFGNRWYKPSSADELQTELATIKTHATSVVDLQQLLARHKVILADEGLSPVKVAEALAKVEWSGDEKEAAVEMKEFDDLVGRLDFGTTSVGAGAESFLKALQDISDVAASIGAQHIHFPPAKEYHLLSTRAGIVLSRFGPRIPSIGIFKPDQEAKLTEDLRSTAKEAIRKARLLEIKTILIAMKPLEFALKDYQLLKDKKKLTCTSKERSASYRHIQFGGVAKDAFVTGVADLAVGWKGEDEPVASGSQKGPSSKVLGKRKAGADVATFKLDF